LIHAFPDDKAVMDSFFDGDFSAQKFNSYGHLQNFNKATVALYHKWDELKSPIKIIPFIGAQCDSPGENRCANFFSKNSAGRSAQHRALDFFIRIQKLYPNLSVIYEG